MKPSYVFNTFQALHSGAFLWLSFFAGAGMPARFLFDIHRRLSYYLPHEALRFSRAKPENADVF